ncbi:hypothetical protein HALLA_13695 [Halostagnicola larsenii XH-48]|uniref:Uncharacterized protein n=1 Tax=Halostagnicola larsenii XH-48 TaxID=797299 RepID=W0JM52_9EURY|nr:hypothetical protein [Halostagnicola larsenii]AHF99678.1 hypothetical protein HALLA_13695 [Halostagnicola larsenii XH-48]
MSVISQPEVLGQTTRRRVIGMTAAACTTGIEALAVGTWFLLVVLETRTAATALAGVGVLFCGSLLRASIFGATTSELGDILEPRRLCTAVFVTAGWVLWLLVAESIGGVAGVLAGGVVLVGTLLIHFSLERRVFHGSRPSHGGPRVRCGVVPAVLIALGATALLSSVWFVDWSFVSPPISLEVTRFVLRLEAVQIGFVLFGFVTFLAYQLRFTTTLES